MSREGEWHAHIVAGLVAYRPGVYVEIGIRRGLTFNRCAPLAGEAHAVDPSPGDGVTSQGTHWLMTSDEFFSQWQGMADVVFIDGDHETDQVRRDFTNSLDRLNAGGVIALHDTWPTGPDDPDTGGAWRVAEQAEQDPGLETFTFTTWPGLTLVRRADDERRF